MPYNWRPFCGCNQYCKLSAHRKLGFKIESFLYGAWFHPPSPLYKVDLQYLFRMSATPGHGYPTLFRGEGGSLSSMFQLAITCIVEITCNLHCIHRIRQTILIQNVVQDDTRNMPLMFVCKCHGPQPCTTYTIFLLPIF